MTAALATDNLVVKEGVNGGEPVGINDTGSICCHSMDSAMGHAGQKVTAVCTFVSAYKRKDGREVEGHWQNYGNNKMSQIKLRTELIGTRFCKGIKGAGAVRLPL